MKDNPVHSLSEWVNRSRSNFFKSTSALSCQMAEALWWVMERHDPYKFWQGGPPQEGAEVIQVGNLLVSTTTGEILDGVDVAQSIAE